MAKKVKTDGEADVGVASEGFVEEYVTKPSYDVDGVQVSSGIGADGLEYPDPVPMSPPVGFSNPPDLMHMIRTMIRSEEFLRAADDEGIETFEEAGDFDIDDDPLPPLTLHEQILVPPVSSPQGGDPPPASTTDPQVSDQEVGGKAGGSPNTPPAAAPSEPKPSTST